MSIKRALQLPFIRIANATWMQRFIEDELGHPCLLLIGGVNRDVFRPVGVPRDDSVFSVLCSGDLRERKGTDTIEEAMAIAVSTRIAIMIDVKASHSWPLNDSEAGWRANALSKKREKR